MNAQHQMPDPQASRPYMPGYGVLDADSGNGLLPWSWAAEQLTNSHNYLLTTVRPDGCPHSMPVWGLWLDGLFYFSTGRQSRKGRNLAANRECIICTEHVEAAVIVEGTAEKVTDRVVLKPFYKAYKAKYDWDTEQEPYVNEPGYAVHPRVAFAILEKDLSGSATRWKFDGDDE